MHRVLARQPDRDHRDRGGEAGQLVPADERGPTGVEASKFLPASHSLMRDCQSTDVETAGSRIGLVAPVSESGNLANSVGYSGRREFVSSMWLR